MTSVDLVAAARPNFMKVAPLWHALQSHRSWCTARLVHTGQHYDPMMSDAFVRDLGLPQPDLSLEVGSGTHAEQTAAVMVAYERACMASRPDWTVVVGDVNSTVACALAAKKLLINVAHLEAGLRSGDRTMPEEINRVVTDAIADLLWTPSEDGDENLLREGVRRDRIERVGNIMIDSFEMQRDAIEKRAKWREVGLSPGQYGVVTLHRPSNVDDPETLRRVLAMLGKAAERIPMVFPIHPRTRQRIEALGTSSSVSSHPGLKFIEPLGYVDFMSLVIHARLALTDSGGLQEETSYLGIPCLTLRDSTERPITVSLGTNRLVRVSEVGAALSDAIEGKWPKGQKLPLWDGHTAERVVESLRRRASAGQ